MMKIIKVILNILSLVKRKNKITILINKKIKKKMMTIMNKEQNKTIKLSKNVTLMIMNLKKLWNKIITSQQAIKEKKEALTNLEVALSMKESGQETCVMEMEYKLGPMVPAMRVNH